ncbi:MAG: 2-amino-4-hydroxy-6-hydroxymethyldihydropteridine diphosphokinase [Muribaculaceae bacterium]|nr:2-amino-4-hydroxy-6-hydroxymethyldihydropteridine diphosphokinase [Muribaculaceae bacterium]
MNSIYLNLGSNRGDCRANINRAVELISARYPVARVRRSMWVTTPSWGYDSPNEFVNLGVALDFDSPAHMPDPMGLLRAVKHIEQQVYPGDVHRDANGNYSDRYIDIDIIAIDNLAIESPELTIPHPRAAAREFVMRPMMMLCPGWNPGNAHLGLKKTIDQMNRPSIDQCRHSPKIPLTLVLDNLRSLNNIGSIFRTADAFAVEHITLCGISATPPSPEIHKTALGAEMSVDWSYSPDTLTAVRHLKEQGYIICCLEQVNGSVSLETFVPDPSKRYALVAGNEVAGVDPAIVEICDIYLEIPQAGIKHSLNVAVSTAVALWQFFSRLKGGFNAG